MADQGAIGTNRDDVGVGYVASKKRYMRTHPGTFREPNVAGTRTVIANTAYVRAVWHYNKQVDVGFRPFTGGVAFARNYIANTAVLRAAQHYLHPFTWLWQYNTGTLPINLWPVVPAILKTAPQGSHFNDGMATNGSITGKVTVATVAQVDVAVCLIWRQTKQIIGMVRTDANGDYTFTGLDPTKAESYAVIAFDLEAGTDYNIGRQDRLTAG
jgi:hypothetical protein